MKQRCDCKQKDLADTVILLRYFESIGQVRRAVSIIKKRMGYHQLTICEYRIGHGELTLGEPLRDFQGNMVTTGIGCPVSPNTREYTKEGIPLTIIDAKGIEAADYEGTRSLREKALRGRNESSDAARHVRVAWLCISEDSRRIEQTEIDLLALLRKYRVSTVAVITKARSGTGFKAQVESLLPEARQFLRVCAPREQFDEGQVLEPMGLAPLVEVTIQLLPDGHKNAFVAAQKVDIQRKVERGDIAVGTAAVTAGSAGATPIPFSNAIGIVPIQITMVLTISGIFGLGLSQDFVTAIVGSELRQSAERSRVALQLAHC